MQFVKTLIHDVATLKRPVTAAAVVAFVLAVVAPFGVDPADVAVEKLTGAIAAVGVAFAYVEPRLRR